MTAVFSIKNFEGLKQIKVLLPCQLALQFLNMLFQENLILEKLWKFWQYHETWGFEHFAWFKGYRWYWLIASIVLQIDLLVRIFILILVAYLLIVLILMLFLLIIFRWAFILLNYTYILIDFLILLISSLSFLIRTNTTNFRCETLLFIYNLHFLSICR